MPYAPPDPARPWRDFQVQNCARRFLNEVVLVDWRTNHPHPMPCPNIYLFYAYNQFASVQKYGTSLNDFLRTYCDLEIALSP